ncbi:MarR family transcriptional regulator [Chitinophaga parva]|uniref:MarR family transcriptional regulator n=1 Tax=Chitinophaga parva TaxID=2169414 RepID=A0A2T7BPI0_9BACT|nr:MarR family transcriptional regulator [Chitinophaga parva]PUZ29584.1 MarR family transcriptional regulator [Chitinophaga parva]
MSSKQQQQLVTDLRTVVTRLVKKLRTKSSLATRLSLTERSVLSQLDHQHSLLPSELAAMEKVTTQSMSQILARLLEMNLIVRTPSATDGRKVIISLSAEGKRMIQENRNRREEWLTQALERVTTAEEQAHLRSAINAMAKIIEYDE